MSDHATHCKDPHCFGCSCTPDCDYWAEEPNVLVERNRIIALLEEEASANDEVKNPYDAGYIRALIGIIREGTA